VRWRHLKNSGLLVLASLAASIGTSTASFAVTTVQSQVCEDFAEPAIVSPSDGTQTTDDTVMIEGVGAPGKTVVMTRGSSTVGTSTVASDGSFGFTVPLEQGDNTFIARESNECGTEKDSSPVTVYADLPVPPVTEPAGGNGESSGNGSSQPVASAPSEPSEGAIGERFPPRPNTPGFEKPKVTSPRDGTTVYLDTLLVKGSAAPGSLVTIYVNGVSQAQVVSSQQGTFQVRVVLEEGVNTIKIRSVLGGKTATSDGIKVTYIRKITATLSRPLSTGEIINTIAAAVAAVVGGAAVAALLHRYGTRPRKRE
jgi:hypothetical protein